MRGLVNLDRRQFALGASAALTLIGRGAAAHDGAHLHKVTIRKFTFDPAVLTIQPGDTVEWVNEDAAPHTASDVDGAWDTGEIVKKASAKVTFDGVGTFAYFCAYHSHMKGQISVSEAPEP